MHFNFLNIILLVAILCLKFTNPEKNKTKFTEILLVESLTNRENPVSGETLEVPRSIFTKKEEAESYIKMLENTVNFEKKLKKLLSVFLKLRGAKNKHYFMIENEYQDIFKVGVELYNFEKKLKANFLKFNSNSAKKSAIFVQPNEIALGPNEKYWNCKESTNTIRNKKDLSSKFLCLLMVYKLRILIAKAHPDTPEVQWQPTLQENDSEHLSPYDIERIYIIQNTEINRIIVKKDIDVLENEQGYDTLVIPYDIYQNDDSMQTFKDFYQKFWSEIEFDNMAKCLVFQSKESTSTLERKVFKPRIHLINSINHMGPCLKFLDGPELSGEIDGSCTEQFLSYPGKKRASFLKLFDNCQKEPFIHLPLTSNVKFVQVALLSWVILMERLTLKTMNEEHTFKLGIDPKELKSIYDVLETPLHISTQDNKKYSKSQGQKRSSEVPNQALSKVKGKKKISREEGSLQGQTHDQTLYPYFQGTQDGNQMSTTTGSFDTGNQPWNHLTYPSVAFNHHGIYGYIFL
ncbi:hypothetical protein HMI55_002955, partial [Coelomomyces lativittatus]